MSPAGGLSLIIHILINVFVFIYRKFVKLFKLSDTNLVGNSFAKLTNKEGDTAVRKILAYCFIAFTLLAMGTNFVFITLRLVELGQTKVAQVQGNLNLHNPFTNESETVNAIVATSTTETATSTATTSPSRFKNIEIASSNLANIDSISLVDFMRNVGIVDTSFESRSELAVELGVIKNASDYSGTDSQNSQIKNKLKEELNKHLVNH